MPARIWPTIIAPFQYEASPESKADFSADLDHAKATDRSIEDIALGAIQYWASGDLHPCKDEADGCAACQAQPNHEFCAEHYWSDEDLRLVSIVQESLSELVAAALKSHYGWRQA